VLLGSTHVKAALKMLVKSTPGEQGLAEYRAPLSPVSSTSSKTTSRDSNWQRVDVEEAIYSTDLYRGFLRIGSHCRRQKCGHCIPKFIRQQVPISQAFSERLFFHKCLAIFSLITVWLCKFLSQ